MRFLIVGDVNGRPGREAVTHLLPTLRQETSADSVIINIENLAHGAGISPETANEALTWGADVYTTGDHAWDNEQGVQLLDDPKLPIIRPANYPPGVPGRGWHAFQRDGTQVVVINLQGQVFFRTHPDNPFRCLDSLLREPTVAAADIVLVDFHAEATSEKRALGWHADGRVAAVWGTHTHVPTADAQILPQGCGYITDVGMVGSYHSIIGVDRAGPLKSFLTQLKSRPSFETPGPRELGALVLDVDPATHQTIHIAHLRKILNA